MMDSSFSFCPYNRPCFFREVKKHCKHSAVLDPRESVGKAYHISGKVLSSTADRVKRLKGMSPF